MSGVPKLKRLTFADLPPGAPKALEPIVNAVNQILEFENAAFANGIEYQRNIRCHIRELEVRTLATYSSGDFDEVTFDSGIKAKLIDVRVLQVIDLDDPEAMLQGSFGMEGGWRDDGGRVRIGWIDGLEDSKRYWIRFEAR